MSKTTDDGKACAVLAYLLFGIIWFFADDKMRKNTFAKFHVKQAVVFLCMLIVVALAVALFSMISKTFGEILGGVLSAAMIILWIIMVVYAASGKEKGIPVFGVFSKMLKF